MSLQIKDIGEEIRESFQPDSKQDTPYIGLSDIEQDNLVLSRIGSSKEVSSQKYRFRKGDILFSTLRPYFRKVIIAPTNGICSTEFSVIRPFDKSDQYFLFYCMAQPEFIKYATKKSKGDRPRTKWKLYSDFNISFGNGTERRGIGEYLANYDKLIENNRRRIELLEKSAKLLYKEWFVHLRFPGHEHTQITNGVPDGWEKLKIGNYSPFNYGKSLRKDKRNKGLYNVYGSSGIIGTHDEWLIKGPCIIIGRKGNVGSVYWSANNCFPIDTVYYIDNNSSSLFLYYALQNANFINTDVAVPGLNRDFAHSRKILFPPKTMRIEFESVAKDLHSQIKILVDTNKRLSKARDLLIPKLMNGDITV